MKSIRDVNVKGKRVLLRVDFNVPMEDKRVADDNRIRQSLSTIQHLVTNKAKVIILTHLGRPEGQVIAELSTVPLAQRLAEISKHRVYATDHVIHPKVNEIIGKMKKGDILMLGNLRWHGEEESDIDVFAKDLASYGDLYVNDAFGTANRKHASVYSITKFLPSYAGFLFESEIATLKILLDNPKRPFIVVLGGAKMKGKIGLIEKIAPKADKILIGGAIGNTFLAAQGKDVSGSLVEKEMFEKCENLLKKLGNKIVLPIDMVKKELPEGGFSFQDIGPKTQKLFVDEVTSAGTVFWNGNLGHSEDEAYARGTFAMVKALSESPNTSIIAGGDTVGFVRIHGLSRNINFISTGGGATSQFLAGEKLPGVEALDNSRHF